MPVVLVLLSGHHQVEVLGIGPVGAGGRGGEGLVARLHEVAGGLLQAGERQLVLQRVGQFDVADAAVDLPDIGGHALDALAAHAGGPLDRGAFADLRLPFGADLRQVVDEVDGGAGAVGATDHEIGRASCRERVCQYV